MHLPPVPDVCDRPGCLEPHITHMEYKTEPFGEMMGTDYFINCLYCNKYHLVSVSTNQCKVTELTTTEEAKRILTIDELRIKIKSLKTLHE
jgi:hypothetical protein